MINIERGNVVNNKWNKDDNGLFLKITDNQNNTSIIPRKDRLQIANTIYKFTLNESEIMSIKIDQEIKEMDFIQLLKYIKNLGFKHFETIIEEKRKSSLSHWTNDQSMIDFVNNDYNTMLYIVELYLKEDKINEALKAWGMAETAIRDNLYEIIAQEIKKIKLEEVK